jgi:type III restriction enzyme
MKLHFESDLPYQAAAIEAVCDLFRGQEVCRSEFTVTMRALSASPLVPEVESAESVPWLGAAANDVGRRAGNRPGRYR